MRWVNEFQSQQRNLSRLITPWIAIIKSGQNIELQAFEIIWRPGKVTKRQAEPGWESMCGKRFVRLSARGYFPSWTAPGSKKPQAYRLEMSVQRCRAAGKPGRKLWKGGNYKTHEPQNLHTNHTQILSQLLNCACPRKITLGQMKKQQLEIERTEQKV